MKLYLVTNGYPIKQNEAPFIEPELQEIKKHYDVEIIACLQETDVIKAWSNENDLPVHTYIEHKKNLLQLAQSIFTCLHLVFFKEALDIILHKSQKINRLFEAYCEFTQALDFSRWIEKNKIINPKEKGIYYTYWNVYYSLAMCLSRKKYPCLKCISRAHEYDLYERNEPGLKRVLSFRKYIASKADKIIFISQDGKEYFEKFYGEFREVLTINRLGVFEKSLCRDNARHPFLIVSCSSVIDRKRVDRIAKAIYECRTDRQIKWVHFGTGDRFYELTRLCENLFQTKANKIQWELKGFVKNSDVMRYYSDNDPHCFINISSSEGSPVSVQEAVAFGIPVILSDAGGNRELVSGNGALLENNPQVEDIASAIDYVAELDSDEFNKLRNNSVGVWSNQFDREKNINEFLELLKQI